MGFSMRASSDEQLVEEGFEMVEDHLNVNEPHGGEGSRPHPPPPPSTPPPRTISKSRNVGCRSCSEGERGKPSKTRSTLDQRSSVHHQHRPTTSRQRCFVQAVGVCRPRDSEGHSSLQHSDADNNPDDIPADSVSRRCGSKVTSDVGRSGVRRAAPREVSLPSRMKVGQSLSENGKRARRQVGARLPRAKKTVSDSSVGDKKTLSKSPVQDKDEVMPVGLLKQRGGGGQTITVDSDASLEGSGISLVEINMSEYQLAVLGNVDSQGSRQRSDKGTTVCEQLQPCGPETRTPTSDTQRFFRSDVNDGTTTITNNEGDDPRANAAVAELVGGLDSQISALCRNLASLLVPDRWLTEEAASPRAPSTTLCTRNPSDSGVSGAVGRPDSVGMADSFSRSEYERYCDCLSSDNEAADVLSDRGKIDSEATKKVLQAAQRQDKADVSSKENNSKAKKFSALSSLALDTFQNENQSFANKTVVDRWAWRQSDHTLTRTCTHPLPNTHTEVLDKNTENSIRGKTLLPASRDEELLNVVEISAELPDLQEMETDGNTALADACRRKWDMLADGAGKLAGTWTTWLLQDLTQVLDQSDVLRATWQNHKMQLADVLANRDREAERGSRLEQGLARARHVIQSLRRQRRQVLQYLEQKEEQWATALRSHRNEAIFLRRKVLVGLEEKRHMIAGPKKDGRLAAILDSLLALHVEREHFLALDIAKQNKINELKLLAVRQELSLQELKERNTELDHVIAVLLQCLPNPGTGTRATDCFSTPPLTACLTTHGGEGGGCSCAGSEVTDLLYCDRAVYLPRHSTCPDLVSVKVYNLGGEQSHLGLAVEDTFDVSRQNCNPDGDYHTIYRDHITYSDRALAEDLLRELSLYGPGSPEFTLADVQ